MTSEPRFVFDTNVVISALLLSHSVARQAFDRATQTGKLLISSATVEELNAVLQRKGFERYITEEDLHPFRGVAIVTPRQFLGLSRSDCTRSEYRVCPP